MHTSTVVLRCTLLAVAISGCVALGAAPSAFALDGLERVAGFTDQDTSGSKTAFATCPEGKVVVGGGGLITDGGARRPRLTALQPSGKRTWIASAETPNLGQSFAWKLGAYGLCVDEDAMPGYEIETESHASRDPFKQVDAQCRNGKVAYGPGASILFGNGRVGLQLNRTDGRLGIARAAARADTLSYDGSWWLTSHAVCAERNGNPNARGGVSAGTEAFAICDSGQRVHGPGGGGGLVDGGPSWLYRVFPREPLRSVEVQMTSPLHPSIGGMVAHTTCAT